MKKLELIGYPGEIRVRMMRLPSGEKRWVGEGQRQKSLDSGWIPLTVWVTDEEANKLIHRI